MGRGSKAKVTKINSNSEGRGGHLLIVREKATMNLARQEFRKGLSQYQVIDSL